MFGRDGSASAFTINSLGSSYVQPMKNGIELRSRKIASDHTTMFLAIVVGECVSCRDRQLSAIVIIKL